MISVVEMAVAGREDVGVGVASADYWSGCRCRRRV